MSNDPKPFVVARNKCIVPKERRIERIPSGYSVREFHDDDQGHYWCVVTALGVMAADQRCTNRT
jgi:hypothetical protein